MKIDAVTAVIRPRTQWEAVDLGFSLVRQWAVNLWRLWALTALPLALATVALCYLSPLYAVILIWWLKPLFDRIVLFYLSRDLFSDPPTASQTWRRIGQWLKSPGLWTDLTVHRFSPRRALMLPIHQLEELTGTRLKQRRRAIGLHSGGQASWAQVLCILFETVCFFGLLLTGVLLIPEVLQPDWQSFFQDMAHWIFGGELTGATEAMPRSYKLILVLTYLAAVSIIEPFYVGAGFGLYLNARTHLEGWDIELSFKRMSERIRRSATVAVLLGLFVLAAVPPAGAQNKPLPPHTPSPEASAAPEQAIERVLADPDFEWRTAKHKRYELRKTNGGFGHMGGLGSIGRVLVWVLLGVLVAAVAWVLLRYFLNRAPMTTRTSATPNKASPDVVMGMDVRPGSLPVDLVAEAMRLWRDGRGAEALSLLYRGAISRLIADDQLAIEPADTEHDCVRRMENLRDEQRRSYFGRLTDAWVMARYARREPDDRTMQQLCQNWPFATGGAA